MKKSMKKRERRADEEQLITIWLEDQIKKIRDRAALTDGDIEAKARNHYVCWDHGDSPNV